MFFAKNPRHTRQNAITEGELECILTRNCEGTEQLRNEKSLREQCLYGIAFGSEYRPPESIVEPGKTVAKAARVLEVIYKYRRLKNGEVRLRVMTIRRNTLLVSWYEGVYHKVLVEEK